MGMASRGIKVLLGALLAVALVPTAAFGATVGDFQQNAEEFGWQLGAATYYQIVYEDVDLPQWNGDRAGVQPSKGSGTVDDPYLADNANEFRWCLANQKSVRLTNDIDMGGRQQRNWGGIVITEPIVIDGDGHILYNYYSNCDNRYNGLIEELRHPDAQLVNFNVNKAHLNCYKGSQFNNNVWPNHWSSMLVSKFVAGQVKNVTVRDAWCDGYGSGTGDTASLFAIYQDDKDGGDILIENVHAENVAVISYEGCAGFVIWARNSRPHKGNVTVRNCSSVNGRVTDYGSGSPSGHGGFATHINQAAGYETLFENCFAANATTSSGGGGGGFVGKITQGKATFRNCFSAGTVYGPTNVGGFLGTDATGQAVFENCYSVTATTPNFGRVNLSSTHGGFAGNPGAGTVFKNCYAAGEVGWLSAGPEGQLGNSSGGGLSKNMGKGFSGNGRGAITNCFYDKQLTAMADNGAITGVEAKLTTEMMEADLGDAFVNGEGLPQLKCFAESDNPRLRAWSEVSTVAPLLYVNAADSSDYDTVRSVRTGFPLTGGGAGRAASPVRWKVREGPDPAAPYENVTHALTADDPVLDLRGNAVTSVAPGVAVLRATKEADGVTAARNVRLVPGTGAITGGSHRVILAQNPNLPAGAVEPTDPTVLTFDLRQGIQYVSATPYALYRVQKAKKAADPVTAFKKLGGTVQPMALDGAGDLTADGALKFDLSATGRNSILTVTVEKKGDSGWAPFPLTSDTVSLFEGERRATMAERGSYRFNYAMASADGADEQGEFSRTLDVVEPAWVEYLWNDGKHTSSDPSSERSVVYRTDPGVYVPGTTLGEKLAPLPESGGKTALWWASSRRGDFDGGADKPADEFTAETPLVPGKNQVYALWRIPEDLTTRSDSYTVLVEPGASPLTPDELINWGRHRYEIPEEGAVGPVTITTPGGAPVPSIDLTKPGSYVVHVPVEDDGTGEGYEMVVDFRVGWPPEVAVNPTDPDGEPKVLKPESTTADAEKGIVEGRVSDTVTYPTQPGKRETAGSLATWAQARYRIPGDCSIALAEMRDALGAKVSAIDKGVASQYDLLFTIADDRGNKTSLAVRYILRETPKVEPVRPGDSDLVEKDPVPGDDDKAHRELEEKIPVIIDPIEIGPDHKAIDKDEIRNDLEERYRFDDASKVEIEVRDPDGNLADEIDTTVPGVWSVTVRLTGPEGDTTTIYMKYVVRKGAASSAESPDQLVKLPDAGAASSEKAGTRLVRLARTGDALPVFAGAAFVLAAAALGAVALARKRLRRR